MMKTVLCAWRLTRMSFGKLDQCSRWEWALTSTHASLGYIQCRSSIMPKHLLQIFKGPEVYEWKLHFRRRRRRRKDKFLQVNFWVVTPFDRKKNDHSKILLHGLHRINKNGLDPRTGRITKLVDLTKGSSKKMVHRAPIPIQRITQTRQDLCLNITEHRENLEWN